MKKYFQITVVLGLFFSFVLFKTFYKGDSENVQVGANNINQQAQVISVTPTPTPTVTTQPTTAVNPTSGVVPTKAPPTPTPTPAGKYKSGTFTGTSEDAIYGNIKVQAVISNGKITDVVFLDHPGDNRTSEFINSQAMPMLKAEAISAQSANVDIISGASDSSMAFQQSLANALAQAQ